jgi:hypothetical protein
MSHGPSGLTNGSRLLLCGDSLLYNPGYPTYGDYLASYLYLSNPSLAFDVISMGRSGVGMFGMLDGSDISYQLYRRWFAPLEPTHVFSMWADNGGYDKPTFKAYAQDLVDNYIIGIDGASPILLGMIPQANLNGYGLGDDYDDALQEIAEAATPDHAYAKLWRDLRENSPAPWAQSENWSDLSYDQVHPKGCATILASWRLIHLLGWDTTVSAATLTAAGSVTSSTDCTISNAAVNAYGGIDFDRLDARLPWAIDETAPDGTGRAEALAMYPAFAGWQSYTLTVTGLSAGTYDVICNGVTIGTPTHTELSAGWNMADLTAGPVWDKCQAALAAIRALQGINPTTLVLAAAAPYTGVINYESTADGSYPSNSGSAGAAAHKSNLAAKIANLETLSAAVTAAAQPETLSFSIRLQGYTPPPTGNKRSQAHVARILAAAL